MLGEAWGFCTQDERGGVVEGGFGRWTRTKMVGMRNIYLFAKPKTNGGERETVTRFQGKPNPARSTARVQPDASVTSDVVSQIQRHHDQPHTPHLSTFSVIKALFSPTPFAHCQPELFEYAILHTRCSTMPNPPPSRQSFALQRASPTNRESRCVLPPSSILIGTAWPRTSAR